MTTTTNPTKMSDLAFLEVRVLNTQQTFRAQASPLGPKARETLELCLAARVNLLPSVFGLSVVTLAADADGAALSVDREGQPVALAVMGWSPLANSCWWQKLTAAAEHVNGLFNEPLPTGTTPVPSSVAWLGIHFAPPALVETRRHEVEFYLKILIELGTGLLARHAELRQEQ